MSTCTITRQTIESAWCEVHARGFLMCEKIRMENRVRDLELEISQLRRRINKQNVVVVATASPNVQETRGKA